MFCVTRGVANSTKAPLMRLPAEMLGFCGEGEIRDRY